MLSLCDEGNDGVRICMSECLDIFCQSVCLPLSIGGCHLPQTPPASIITLSSHTLSHKTQSLTDALFVCFALSFFSTRLIVYPFW